MITILGTEGGIDALRPSYPVSTDPATRDRIELVTYRDALRRSDWQAGAIVFGDLERLFVSDVPDIVRLWQRFEQAEAPVRLLNHPTRSLRRFALLRRLHASGVNDFDVWRADELRDGMRFPVLLHGERDHNGPLGGLVRDRAALDRQLAELTDGGAVLSQILVIEFCDTRSDDGLYRKIGTFRIGDRFLHRHMMFSNQWCVKTRRSPIGEEHSREALVDEEERFMLGDEVAPDVPAIFRLAQIEFGRMDYAFKDGAIRVWEINTSPMLGNGERYRPGIELYDRFMGRSFEQMRDALLALEDEPGDQPFWIEPVFRHPAPPRPGARTPVARPAARWRRLFGR